MGLQPDILKELRRDKGLTQEDMGNRLGISGPMYSYLENGKRPLSIDRLCEIADILDTSTDYILGRTADKDIPARRNRTNTNR